MTSRTHRRWLGVMIVALAVGVANRYTRNVALADGPCNGGCGAGQAIDIGEYQSSACPGGWCAWTMCSDSWDWETCSGGFAPHMQIWCSSTDCKL
jgi:hypothetical protein